MFVTYLEIKKPASYETDAGQFKATVKLEGSGGSQTINLSAAAISRIFGVIASEVIDTSRKNAVQVKAGMKEAIHEPLLLDSSEIDA